MQIELNKVLEKLFDTLIGLIPTLSEVKSAGEADRISTAQRGPSVLQAGGWPPPLPDPGQSSLGDSSQRLCRCPYEGQNRFRNITSASLKVT